MKMKTSELTGLALDWAVAKCKNIKPLHCGAGPNRYLVYMPKRTAYQVWRPSTSWVQGGPIIEGEGIAIDCIRCDGKIDGWVAALPMFDEAKYEEPSPTPLVAAMRCYVASVLGDEIDVPEEVAA